MIDLSGRRALITGASRGIGRAAALSIGQAGAHVLVHYGRGAKEAQGVVDEIIQGGGRAQVVSGDMSDPEGPRHLAAQVRTIVGDRLDILVANAGISRPATIADTTIQNFDELFAVNVRAPFFLVQQLLPLFKQGSSIIVTSSLAAHAAVDALSAYSMTKGALDTMIKHFAYELGPRGIRVNAVAPGIIATDMSEFAKTEQGQQYAINMQALKRVGQASDIGGIYAFLASDEARWITGDTVRADGGSKL